MHMAKIWFKEIRADFLVLSVVLTAIGGAAAAYDGFFSWPLFLLTVFGVVCAHAAVNLFNEYSDWRTGIDAATVRTPFSGGSGMMQAGLTNPAHVRLAAWGALALSGTAGTILAFLSGPLVPVLMLVGGVTVVTYTDHLARWGIGEVASGLSLGTLVVIGAAYVQTGDVTGTAVWAGIPAGLLTMQLLFLNEFPDAEADAVGGRRHLVILLGKQRAAVLYAVVMAAVYAVIITGAAVGVLPPTVLVSLAALPLAAGAAYKALRYPDHLPGLVPGLAMNVIAVLATDALLAAGLAAG